jgi:bifunctional UDP-N-acetylglucosamine pyrophosphorylase/glucosamine-1-phosphate N-acetyltransferase
VDEKTIKVGEKGISGGRGKLGTVIADNVKTGINCKVNVGVKIGPNSAIKPGAVVYKDVPPNTIVSVEHRVKKRVLK